MVNMSWRPAAVAVILVGVAAGPALAQPNIVLDYTYDTNNFFGAAGSAPRLALQAAADRLQARLGDTLSAITPGGVNSWTATFDHPGNGTTVNLSNPTIALNEIRVFAGGRDLASPTLGIGGPGGFSAGGTQAFFNAIGRGQYDPLSSAASQTDFAPWGGAITFDTVGTTWNFDLSGPVAGQIDFLSVAEHELGHLLGIGTADSWYNRITGTTFTGPASTALLGTNPSVTADGGHWASGTSYMGQEAAMTPSISAGVRKEFTELDFAGLSDLGWQVLTPVPEPVTVLGLAAGALGLARVVRRKRTAPTLAA
jgi:hypothetical protein